MTRLHLRNSNAHYETNFGVSRAKGSGNTKIGFLKAHVRWAFKKPIFIMRIAAYAKNKKESAKRTLFCLTCQERDLNS